VERLVAREDRRGRPPGLEGRAQGPPHTGVALDPLARRERLARGLDVEARERARRREAHRVVIVLEQRDERAPRRSIAGLAERERGARPHPRLVRAERAPGRPPQPPARLLAAPL